MFLEIITKKRSEVTEEIAVIESRFRMSDIAKRPTISAADNNGDGPNDGGRRHHQGDASHKDGEHHKLSLTKHDRRSPHDEDDDDDEDSPYRNSDDDEENNHQSDDNSSVVAPDISIVKKECNLIIFDV